MRLGGPVYDYASPDEWTAALRAAGYRAAYCPVAAGADSAVVRAYAEAAPPAGNGSFPGRAQLARGDEIGARCGVNIAGSTSEKWDGPDAGNLTPATFDLIVETVRSIIDAVQPRRTVYALETMPWAYPDTVDSYLALIEAI